MVWDDSSPNMDQKSDDWSVYEFLSIPTWMRESEMGWVNLTSILTTKNSAKNCHFSHPLYPLRLRHPMRICDIPGRPWRMHDRSSTSRGRQTQNSIEGQNAKGVIRPGWKLWPPFFTILQPLWLEFLKRLWLENGSWDFLYVSLSLIVANHW